MVPIAGGSIPRELISIQRCTLVYHAAAPKVAEHRSVGWDVKGSPGASSSGTPTRATSRTMVVSSPPELKVPTVIRLAKVESIYVAETTHIIFPSHSFCCE
jgi:hypothetical protein